jgi:hypothetical protein
MKTGLIGMKKPRRACGLARRGRSTRKTSFPEPTNARWLSALLSVRSRTLEPRKSLCAARHPVAVKNGSIGQHVPGQHRANDQTPHEPKRERARVKRPRGTGADHFIDKD